MMSHHVPFRRPDLVDGLLILDVLFQRATPHEVPIRDDLAPAGSLGQSGDLGGQLSGPRRFPCAVSFCWQRVYNVGMLLEMQDAKAIVPGLMSSRHN